MLFQAQCELVVVLSWVLVLRYYRRLFRASDLWRWFNDLSYVASGQRGGRVMRSWDNFDSCLVRGGCLWSRNPSIFNLMCRRRSLSVKLLMFTKWLNFVKPAIEHLQRCMVMLPLEVASAIFTDCFVWFQQRDCLWVLLYHQVNSFLSIFQVEHVVISPVFRVIWRL